MKWRVAAYAWNNATTKRELRAAKTRKLVLRLLAPSTYSFSMPGKHAQALLVTELVTDVTINLTPGITGFPALDVFRGRCGPTQDTLAESGHGVQYSFSDYREVLKRRKLKSDNTISWSNADQSDIAWGMIEPTNGIQKRTNGNYGITRGVGTVTGIKRNKNALVGKYVGKEIDELSQMANGFEWDISPALVFNIYYPTRGSNLGVGIEFGRSVTSLTRSRNPNSFANDDTLTGGAGTTLIETSTATVQTDPQGRWDATVSYPDITDQDTLIARAAFVLSATGVLVPTYNVKLSPGFWRGPTHIGLGDTVRLRVKSGRIDDNLLLRVLEIGVDISDDGNTEDVRLSLGAF